jgi:hypothetical protein
MADEPERGVNCICGRGMHDGGGWDLNTQCGYCDDADEVAALEQERDRVERDYLDATRVGGEIANENARLREAIRERDIDLQGLVELAAIVCAHNEQTGAFYPDAEEVAALNRHIERVNELRATAEGKNDD